MFESWVELSCDLDASRTLRHNPRRKQSVNMNEMVFDEPDETYPALEVHTHDFENWDQDTTIEQLEVYQ